jgi:hypothetical protein
MIISRFPKDDKYRNIDIGRQGGIAIVRGRILRLHATRLLAKADFGNRLANSIISSALFAEAIGKLKRHYQNKSRPQP